MERTVATPTFLFDCIVEPDRHAPTFFVVRCQAHGFQFGPWRSEAIARNVAEVMNLLTEENAQNSEGRHVNFHALADGIGRMFTIAADVEQTVGRVFAMAPTESGEHDAPSWMGYDQSRGWESGWDACRAAMGAEG